MSDTSTITSFMVFSLSLSRDSSENADAKPVVSMTNNFIENFFISLDDYYIFVHRFSVRVSSRLPKVTACQLVYTFQKIE